MGCWLLVSFTEVVVVSGGVQHHVLSPRQGSETNPRFEAYTHFNTQKNKSFAHLPCSYSDLLLPFFFSSCFRHSWILAFLTLNSYHPFMHAFSSLLCFAKPLIILREPHIQTISHTFAFAFCSIPSFNDSLITLIIPLHLFIHFRTLAYFCQLI